MNEITGILVDLFIIFITAKVAGRLFIAIRQPAVVGEVLAGIFIGPFALGWVGVPDEGLVRLFGSDLEAEKAISIVMDVIAELGIIILLFFTGLETRVSELMAVKGRAVLVAVLGFAFPFVFGFALMWAVGQSNVESAFMATAMVATSIGITARVLGDIGVMHTHEARIILGAAVVDDILGLMLLSIVSSAGSGGLNPLELGLMAIEVIVFVIFAVRIGSRVVGRYGMHLERIPVRNAPLVFAIILMLGFSALADIIGLAAIIGSFLAGLMLAEAKDRFALEKQAISIYEFLVPFFFVVTGTKVDLAAFMDSGILAIALVVTALAMLGKFFGGMIATTGFPARSSAIVGAGMMPRGEVGLVTASIGLGMNVISSDMFSVVVFMSLATTVLTPSILVRLYRGYRFKDED